MESVNPEKKLKLDRLLQPNGNASFLQSQMIEVSISYLLQMIVLKIISFVLNNSHCVNQASVRNTILCSRKVE